MNPTHEERLWGLIAHLSPMISLFLGPVFVLVVKGNDSKWVRAHAIEALNFSITLALVYAVGVALFFFIVGLCVLMAAGVFGYVMHVVAGVNAYQGGSYRYPFVLRLIKE